MAKSAPLKIDPVKRVKIIYHEEDGRKYIETRQDCQALVDAAKILAEVPPRKEDGWRFVGFIPDAVFNRAATEGWLGDKKAWRKWLQDNPAFAGGKPRF